MAQAHYEPWWQPYGLYATIDDEATMVGFGMYGRLPATGLPVHYADAKPGVDFILRFMIDQRYQGRGYGRAGLQVLIAQISAQPGVQAIEISYDVANPVMAHLCTTLGFQPTGHIDNNGEIEARLAS